jgi:TolB-like protein
MNYRRLLADLKRRQVFKVAAVYGATGFIVVQAADVFVPALRLPAAITTAIALLVILGLPIALVVAWAFEVTPGGLRRTDHAAPGELEAIAGERASRRWPVGLAAVAGVALIALSGWWLASGEIGEGRTYTSIAVLPLANLSGSAEFDFFGDGLAEELLSALAGQDSLRVAARTSSFAFKGQDVDIRTIADSLGVETVLEGSVRRSADRVRVTLQLIEAEGGFHLWSEDYDRPLDDLLALQEEIANAVVGALLPRLRGGSGTALVLGGTTDVGALDEYVLGRQKWHTRDVPLLRESVEHMRRATVRDSSFALAWSGLADAIDALAFRDLEARSLVPEGRLAALRALVLEPDLAEGWASAGVLAIEFDLARDVGERALRRAVELKPSYAHAQHQLGGVLRNTGRLSEARPHLGRAVALDPLSPIAREGYANWLQISGDAAAAREQYEIGARLNPRSASGLVLWYAERLGLDVPQAEATAESWATAMGLEDPSAWRIVGRGIVDPSSRPTALTWLAGVPDVPEYDRHQLELALGDTAAAMAFLQARYDAGAADLWRIGTLPQYDPLRKDPRFVAIVRSMGLPNGYDREAATAIWP